MRTTRCQRKCALTHSKLQVWVLGSREYLMNVYTQANTCIHVVDKTQRVHGTMSTAPNNHTQVHTLTHTHTRSGWHTLCSREGISLVCMRELLRWREKPVFVDYGNYCMEMKSPRVCLCVYACICVCCCCRQAVVCWQSRSQWTKSLVTQWLAECVPEYQLPPYVCLF